MRSHPVAGSFFVLLGLGLLALGATSENVPAFLPKLPISGSLLMTFVFWQLAVWSLLFGVFFLRPRGRGRPALAKPALRS